MTWQVVTVGTRELVVGAIIVDSLSHATRVLAARRSRPAALAGAWEFPGGKIEEGEPPQVALRREIREELAVEIEVGSELGTWPINDDLDLRLFFAEITSGDIKPGETHDAVRWLAFDKLTSVSWLPADEQALPAVIEATRSAP
jgi:8-oxo-dGTP diphosphatase